jgi:hypothetical protein
MMMFVRRERAVTDDVRAVGASRENRRASRKTGLCEKLERAVDERECLSLNNAGSIDKVSTGSLDRHRVDRADHAACFAR